MISQGFSSRLRDYTAQLTQDSMRSDFTGLAALGELLLKSKAEGRRVYLAGNGGSAATASHMANDLIKGCRVGEQTGLRAVALTDPNAVITCLANDFAYEDVFSIQLETLADAGDLLIVFSGSGNSENIVRAVTAAKRLGLTTVALTGMDGGKLRGLCDLSIIAPSRSMEQIEDMHLFYEHALVSLVRGELARKQSA